ncbi:putative membrane protein involved in D-alanine export [Desulfosporosinus orientis DSM 765]|uniref:Putative membrane protein involved in D-alanine export n=1 Tax=Desulfosporosinus orientis (strain ATCC 19365 / DSM 765 / NCIMB 8382 / VKM B-1628 / Singapore I) TaxID=768706 RepID=G7W7A5_DESOD|nr:MBOAT family O-acyltransferase [Desulfosporosinus orientis]AET65776.1 putative membrane protein involved in D-alanine export [Desulfosporosinus orientis DSM 765]
MLFNSLQFLVFFMIVTFIYFTISHKIRWVWLLITSYYFYMSWNASYAVLIAFSTVITYISGILIDKANGIGNEKRSMQLKKLWVFLSVLINFSILFMFKYYNYFSHSIERIFTYLHNPIYIPSFDYLLPVGISFYTFQALSYTIDVYRNDVKAEKNLGKYALFVSFFPQLVAGPIEKSKHLLHQFDEKHTFDYTRVKNGLLLMLWGLIQKMVVADRLAVLVNTVYNNPSDYRGFEIVIGTVFFAFQIYCDFSAYSDIARGAAEVMGFRLSYNFKSPYFSKSIKEFWRRWHITLGAWFKDYMYIPLGGNRRGKVRTYYNIMAVFIVSGMWHGATINFIIWGALHGAYQVIGDLLKPIRKAALKTFKIRTSGFGYKLYQVIVTFLLVDFAWIFFRAGSFTSALLIIRNMLYFNPEVFTDGSIYNLGLAQKDFILAVLSIAGILSVNLLQRNTSLRSELSKKQLGLRWTVYLSCIVIIMIFGIYGPGYSPEQFVYFQF